MNKFLNLTKINLIAAFRQMNFVRRRANKKNGKGSAYAIVILVIVLMAYMGFIAYFLVQALHPLNLDWLVFVLLFFIISFLVVIMSLYSVNSVLFESTDIEQLFAYPVSRFQILLSKVFGIVVENWIVSLVFALPFFSMYAYYVHPSPVFYIYALICVIIIPLIPICLISVIAYIVSALTSGTKFKNYLNVLLTIVIVAVMIVGINVVLNNPQTSSITSAGTILDGLMKYYPPIGYAVSALYHYNIVDMLISIAWNVLPFVVLCWIFSVFYVSLRSRIVAIKKVKGGSLTFGSSSKLGAMLKKEYARFLYSPMYIMNSCIGVLLMLVFVIAAGAVGKNMQVILDSLKQVGLNIGQITLLVFLFILSITNTTSPSISLEGKNLWIVKSCPVQPKTALTAKLLVHVLTIIPFIIISSIIAIFTLKIGAGGFVTTLITCILFTTLSGLMGLMYNLHYHRFDFYNDMQVVKNSAGVLLNMVTMVIIAAAGVFIYWLLSQFIAVNFYIYAVIFMVIIAGAILYLYRYITTKGEDLFRDLD
ncbi:MAG: hypothetical protein FWD71_06490 [Oscillospiraceae bacterium]|nr:hypothetical protein [Oscillospiraceae bacterium]